MGPTKFTRGSAIAETLRNTLVSSSAAVHRPSCRFEGGLVTVCCSNTTLYYTSTHSVYTDVADASYRKRAKWAADRGGSSTCSLEGPVGSQGSSKGGGYRKKIVQICSFWHKTSMQSLIFHPICPNALTDNFVWGEWRARPLSG